MLYYHIERLMHDINLGNRILGKCRISISFMIVEAIFERHSFS